jgi:hypothetical protein
VKVIRTLAQSENDPNGAQENRINFGLAKSPCAHSQTIGVNWSLLVEFRPK